MGVPSTVWIAMPHVGVPSGRVGASSISIVRRPPLRKLDVGPSGPRNEALSALANGARPVAGGTDLVVGARQGKAPLPEFSLVAIHRVAELAGIAEPNGGLCLGALASHAEMPAIPLVVERFTALADASAIVGSHAMRAHGTLGGNLMNASPAMETGGPPDAPRRDRHAPAWERHAPWLPCGTSSPAPAPPPRTTTSSSSRSTYPRPQLGQEARTSAWSTAARWRSPSSARRRWSCSTAPTVRDARVAITALAPTIRRARSAESALAGSDGGETAVAAAARAAAAAAAPISDVRASERYRTAMAEVIARRAVGFAVARARGEAVPVPASGVRP